MSIMNTQTHHSPDDDYLRAQGSADGEDGH